MASDTFEHTKPHIYVGMIGHGEHGKTTLTAALTKVLSLRSAGHVRGAEQRGEPAGAHGGHAPPRQVEYESARRRYTHIDYLSQADYSKHLIGGAVRLDGTLLVVSALEGIMPDTREQLLLAQRVRVPALVVFLTKVDLIDDRELLELVERELREQLGRLGFPGQTLAVVRGSAQAALDSAAQDPDAPEYQPIWSLLEALDTSIPAALPSAEQPFLMSIEDILEPRGLATVVSGRVERGRIRAGDAVDVVGIHQAAPQRAVVIRLEDARRPLEQGGPGDALQCLLHPDQPIEVRRGQVLARPGSLRPSAGFSAAVHLFDREQGGPRGFFSGYQPRLTFGHADVLGSVLLPDDTEVVLPGDSAQVGVRLRTLVPLEAGQRFVIREGAQIVGSGVVTALDPQAGLESKGVDFSLPTYTLGGQQDPTDPAAPTDGPQPKTINVWIGDRGARPPERLTPGQPYTLSFNVGEALRHSLLHTPDARIPDSDIPAEGLPTTWLVMSNTVALEPLSDGVAVTTKRSNNVTTWQAKFELHIPRAGESATVSLTASPRDAGAARLDLMVQARGELYRHLLLDLAVGAPPDGAAAPPAAARSAPAAAAPVSVRDDSAPSRADQLGLRAPSPWQQPPGTLRIFITGQNMALVEGDVVEERGAGPVSAQVSTDVIWSGAQAAVAGPIGSLRDAAEEFRKTFESYLNAIDPADLAERLARFTPSAAWADLASAADPPHQQSWEQVRQSDKLRTLALQGRRLYDTLFPQDTPLRTWLDQLEPGHRLDIKWTESTPGWVPGLPWGLLYRGDPDEPIEPFGFWGLRFRIRYTAHTTNRLTHKHLGRPEQTLRGHWMYWGGREDDPVLAEARWQRSLWKSKPEFVFAPNDPPGANPRQELRQLLKTKPGAMPVLYFFCRCGPHPASNKPALFFGSTNAPGSVLTTDDLPQSNLSGSPLVFANACTTSATDPYMANDLEAFFFLKGCSAFLGTETKVPIQFASRFAQIFFHFFYRQADPAGTPVAAGEALAQTRLLLWTHYCNIGGILYSYINQYELFMADQAEIAALRG